METGFTDVDWSGLRGRVGLFGGSFDPVHRGHIEIARTAMQVRTLERVVFLPAACSPHKPGGAQATAEHRLAMLGRALAEEPRFAISAIELERTGLSYTRDTLTSIRALADPGAEFFFILGSDCLPAFPRWRAVDELFGLVEFVVIERAGFAPGDLEHLHGELEAWQIERLRHAFVSRVPIEVSSSEVRERLAAGGDLAGMLAPAVSEYIRTHRLYRS